MNRTRLAYGVALVGYFGLFLLLFAKTIWLAPPTSVPVVVVLLVLVGPLLLPLRGLLYGRPYTFAWTSLLALAYFTHGMVEAYSSPAERPLAIIEVLFSTALYGGAVAYSRLRSRELRRQHE